MASTPCRNNNRKITGIIATQFLKRGENHDQKQKQKKLEEQRNALKSGDKVITAGGIHGLVTNVKAHSVTLKVADNVKIEFEKASIVTVISKDNAEPTEPSQEAGPETTT